MKLALKTIAYVGALCAVLALNYLIYVDVIGGAIAARYCQ